MTIYSAFLTRVEINIKKTYMILFMGKSKTTFYVLTLNIDLKGQTKGERSIHVRWLFFKGLIFSKKTKIIFLHSIICNSPICRSFLLCRKKNLKANSRKLGTRRRTVKNNSIINYRNLSGLFDKWCLTHNALRRRPQ